MGCFFSIAAALDLASFSEFSSFRSFVLQIPVPPQKCNSSNSLASLQGWLYDNANQIVCLPIPALLES